MSCALKLDKKALKALRAEIRSTSGVGVFSRTDANVRKGIIRTYTKLKQAYERCKIKAAQELLAAELISSETAAKFKDFIDDYEVSE